VLAALCLSLTVITMNNSLLNVGLPTLARQLHSSNTGLEWIVDGYALVFAGFLMAAGSLGDRFGGRPVMLAGLAVFGVCSLGAAVSHTTTELIVAGVLLSAFWWGPLFVVNLPRTTVMLVAVWLTMPDRPDRRPHRGGGPQLGRGRDHRPRADQLLHRPHGPRDHVDGHERCPARPGRYGLGPAEHDAPARGALGVAILGSAARTPRPSSAIQPGATGSRR